MNPIQRKAKIRTLSGYAIPQTNALAERKNQKEWWEKYIPWKDFLRQVSTVASIGTTLASVAFVGLGTAGSFHGRSDNATIVMIITASKWFAWSASLFTISLFSALAGLYALDVAVIVRVIQDVTHGWASKCLQYLLMIGGIVINAFMFVAIVLVSLGLNTLVGGSGTVVHWSLFII